MSAPWHTCGLHRPTLHIGPCIIVLKYHITLIIHDDDDDDDDDDDNDEVTVTHLNTRPLRFRQSKTVLSQVASLGGPLRVTPE